MVSHMVSYGTDPDVSGGMVGGAPQLCTIERIWIKRLLEADR